MIPRIRSTSGVRRRPESRYTRNQVSSVKQRVFASPEGQDTSDPNRDSCGPELREEQRVADTKKAQQCLDEAAYALHEKTLERYHQELDALLVYAGLFSGILTAFNIEAYQLLRPDATESTLSAIRELTAELRVFPLNDRTQPGSNPPSLRVGPANSFNPPSFVVWVNCLWFASLITSLSAATIALLVKQWLYEARTGVSAESRAATQLLQYRISSVEDWKVWDIALLVPLLLQIALVIFLLGLLILLNNLQAVVATVSTAFAGTLFAFLIVVTLLPAFDSGCCYRAPQARVVALVARPFRNCVQCGARLCARWLASFLSRTAIKNPRAWYAAKDCRFSDWFVLMLQKPVVALSRAPQCLSWQEHDQLALRIQSDKLNIQTAVTAWRTTLDPEQLGNMRVALDKEAGAPLMHCMSHLGIKMDDDIGLPPALRKRNVRGHLGPLVLAAIHQMFTIGRDAQWERFLQKLLNVYTYAEVSMSQGSLSPPVEGTVQTACRVLTEVTAIENLYAALSYLSWVVHIDRGRDYDYGRLRDVLRATNTWVETLQPTDRSMSQPTSNTAHQSASDGLVQSGDEEPTLLQQARTYPQATLIAFRIVALCVLRVAKGATIVPEDKRFELQELIAHASDVIADLPQFLPLEALSDERVKDERALSDEQVKDERLKLCNELAFGLRMLIPDLIAVLHADAADPSPPPTPVDEPIPDVVLPAVDVVHAGPSPKVPPTAKAQPVLDVQAIRDMIPADFVPANVVQALVDRWSQAKTVLTQVPPRPAPQAGSCLRNIRIRLQNYPTLKRSKPGPRTQQRGANLPGGIEETLRALDRDVARFYPERIPLALPHPAELESA